MRCLPVACGALALTLAAACLAACSGGAQPIPPRTGVTALQPEPVSTEEARDLINAANMEIGNLRDMRPRTTGVARQQLDAQIAEIRGRRDKLEADMAGAPSWPSDGLLRVDVQSLERAIRAGASTTPALVPRRYMEEFTPGRELLPPGR